MSANHLSAEACYLMRYSCAVPHISCYLVPTLVRRSCLTLVAHAFTFARLSPVTQVADPSTHFPPYQEWVIALHSNPVKDFDSPMLGLTTMSSRQDCLPQAETSGHKGMSS